jgi:hypothetical protein
MKKDKSCTRAYAENRVRFGVKICEDGKVEKWTRVETKEGSISVIEDMETGKITVNRFSWNEELN